MVTQWIWCTDSLSLHDVESSVTLKLLSDDKKGKSTGVTTFVKLFVIVKRSKVRVPQDHLLRCTKSNTKK